MNRHPGHRARVLCPYRRVPDVTYLQHVDAQVVQRQGLDLLIAQLTDNGFAVIGPTVRDGAVIYDEISKTADLPVGWGDVQDGGHYRLVDRGDSALFGYNLGPTSWKQFLFPPNTEMLHIRRSNGQMVIDEPPMSERRLAFFGVRGCELAAIAIQDKVFLESGRPDRTYASGREDLLIVAVNCTTAAATCFCTSMGTGPGADHGYDLAITELTEGENFLISAGTERGQAALVELDGRPATETDFTAAHNAVRGTAASIVRSLDTDGICELLIQNPDHPRWGQVATLCLTCGNCTQACPTCFCSDVVDTVTLEGTAVRERKWDSCFGLEFSALNGQPVRESTSARYRQWMTHKLATWHDQFGSSGCVGCGRCITWCPVGIDITEEVAAIRETVST